MIFLSPNAQHAVDTYHTVSFGVSSVLNLVSLFCLIYETPPNQAKIRNYLLLTQVMLIINALYMDVLFGAIPLFPAVAMMCTGVLCRAGLPVHSILGGLYITYSWLVLSIYMCCFFRHQTLLPQSSTLSRNKSLLLQASLFVLCAAPSATVTVFPLDTQGALNLIKASPFCIEWVLQRGVPYWIHDRSPIVIASLAGMIVVVSVIVVLFMGTFLHMYHVLKQDKRRSKQAISKIRRSLRVLFVQLVLPLLTLSLPAIVLVTSILCECISFDACLSIGSLILIHPVAHNLILLGITPTYRRLITSLPRRLLNRRQPTQARFDPVCLSKSKQLFSASAE